MNKLDCNGWSPKYKSVRPAMRGLCADPVLRRPGKKAARFIDNGWYVGHDEPSVKFISNAAGSGNTMTYFMKLPVDPKRKPTANGRVTSYAELSLTPWFGLPICDPRSYPQNQGSAKSCWAEDWRHAGVSGPRSACSHTCRRASQ